jgi:hypothetical protein
MIVLDSSPMAEFLSPLPAGEAAAASMSVTTRSQASKIR